jgi:hypothetical protein
MAILTAACLGSLLEIVFGYRGYVLVAARILLVIGSFETVWRRTAHAVEGLRERA